MKGLEPFIRILIIRQLRSYDLQYYAFLCIFIHFLTPIPYSNISAYFN
ncbi:MAG: hypothetical protein JWP12_2483 [Bacteroidetes bacterium]|nr:hypothetical protein [Bacteroidota bacterium]